MLTDTDALYLLRTLNHYRHYAIMIYTKNQENYEKLRNMMFEFDQIFENEPDFVGSRNRSIKKGESDFNDYLFGLTIFLYRLFRRNRDKFIKIYNSFVKENLDKLLNDQIIQLDNKFHLSNFETYFQNLRKYKQSVCEFNDLRDIICPLSPTTKVMYNFIYGQTELKSPTYDTQPDSAYVLDCIKINCGEESLQQLHQYLFCLNIK